MAIDEFVGISIRCWLGQAIRIFLLYVPRLGLSSQTARNVIHACLDLYRVIRGVSKSLPSLGDRDG